MHFGKLNCSFPRGLDCTCILSRVNINPSERNVEILYSLNFNDLAGKNFKYTLNAGYKRFFSDVSILFY